MRWLAAWLGRWWGTYDEQAAAERRRRFNEERMSDDLCECSWTPRETDSLAGMRAANHMRLMHLGGVGECTGRDPYGLRCGCDVFVPKRRPDDGEETADAAR